MEDVRKYLQQIEKIDAKIDDELYELWRLESIRYGLSSHGNTGKVQTSIGNPTEQSAISILDAKKRVLAVTDRFVKSRNRIKKQIEKVENPLTYRILVERYMEHMDFRAIAKKEHYSISYVKNLHSEGLEEFYAKNKKSVDNYIKIVRNSTK